MSTQTPAPNASKRSRTGRLLRWCLGIFALLLVVVLGVSLASAHTARNHLEAATTLLDRTDPNWRLQDLEKDLEPLPDDQNSILLIQRILKEKPANWPSADVQREVRSSDQPWLEPAQLERLHTEMARSPQTLALVRQLARVRHGHVKVNWDAGAMNAVLAASRQAQDIITIARFDAILRMQEHDFDGALESCRAILIAGRGNDACTTVMTMLSRIASLPVCLGETEETLALGQPTEKGLKELQILLEDELAQPLLRQSIRGERAMSYQVIDTYDAKNVALMSLGSAWTADTDVWSKMLGMIQSPVLGSIEANQAMCLESMTELLEAVKQPELEQQPEFVRVQSLSLDWRQPALFRALMPAVAKVRRTYLQGQARLRATVAALAAERYRQKNGRWPEKFADLVPALLKEAVIDPYDGQPLRMRRQPDGLVIYSVGTNGIDDGGDVTSVASNSADTGFRLWDVDQRQKTDPKNKKGK